MRRILLFVFLILVPTLSLHTEAENAQKTAQQLEEEGDSLASSNRNAAFELYADAFRKSNENNQRKKLSKKLLQTKVTKPDDLTEVEKTEVDRVITNIKTYFLRGKLSQFTVPGRIQILNQIVEINPDFADWAKNTIREISHSFLEDLSDEEKAELDKLIADKPPHKLDDFARSFIREKNYRMAIKLYWAYLVRYPKLEKEEREKILEKIHEATTRLVTEVSFEEQEKIDALLKDDQLTQTTYSVSTRFILTGLPSDLNKFKSAEKNKLDVAYILLSDLYSNIPIEPKKTRQVVFLYADSAATQLYQSSIYGMYAGKPCFPDEGDIPFDAYYKGLSDWLNTFPSYRGALRSGIGEIGIQYCNYFIDSSRNAISKLKEFEGTFEKYYVNRALEPREMPYYESAAGFFCHFILKYGMMGFADVNWIQYRSFMDVFRTRKAACLPRSRYNYILAFSLASTYGRRVYEDMNQMRFGVINEHHTEISTYLGALKDRCDAAKKLMTDGKCTDAANDLWKCVNDFPSQIGIDEVFRLLILCYQKLGKKSIVDRLRTRMGIIDSWAVVGPFYDPSYPDSERNLAQIRAPELEINYSRVYTNSKQKANWGTVKSNAEGKFKLSYSYPQNACAYAICYVKCPEETDAKLFFSCNEYHRVWVNDYLVANQTERPGSFSFDDEAYPIHLVKGVNKVLVKMHNYSGALEGGGRIVTSNGLPIPNVEFTTLPLEKEYVKPALPEPNVEMYNETSQNPNKWYSRWLTTTGNFVLRDGILYPQSKESMGKWYFLQKYKSGVYPPPANIAWLRDNQYDKNENLHFTCEITQTGTALPRVLFTFCGEGEDDPQSGISVGLASIFRGERTPYFVVFRYDQLIYMASTEKLAEKTKYTFDIRIKDNKVWLSVNGIEGFGGIGFRPTPNKYPLGLVTWGAGLGFSKILISSLK